MADYYDPENEISKANFVDMAKLAALREEAQSIADAADLTGATDEETVKAWEQAERDAEESGY